jgi:hypothetical protein
MTSTQAATKAARTRKTTAASEAKVTTINEAEDAVVALLEAVKAQTPAQSLAVLDPNDTPNWMEVHKAGCQHLTRGRGRSKGENAWTLEAGSLTEAATEIAHDFIAEGSMTVEEAVENIHWAPCVKLPEDDAQPVQAEPVKAPKAAAKPKELVLKSASEVAALVPAAHLKAEQAARVGADAGPSAPGYIVRWPKAGYDLLLRTAAAPGDGPKWLCRCNEHGMTTPVKGTQEGDRTGRKAERARWCSGCVLASVEAPAAVKAPRKARSAKATAEEVLAAGAADGYDVGDAEVAEALLAAEASK